MVNHSLKEQILRSKLQRNSCETIKRNFLVVKTSQGGTGLFQMIERSPVLEEFKYWLNTDEGIKEQIQHQMELTPTAFPVFSDLETLCVYLQNHFLPLTHWLLLHTLEDVFKLR